MGAVDTTFRPATTDAVALPRQYRLVLTDADDPLDAAQRAVQAGAEEGTLLWVPTAADDTLRAALVLRPEPPCEQALQLAYVALVSLGFAVAELWPAQATLRYRWPTELWLNGEPAGRVQVRYPDAGDGSCPWLLLGISLAGSEAGADVAVTAVLEHFCRHFLAQINRWAEQGFSGIRASFLERADAVEVTLQGAAGCGRFVEIDDNGAVRLEGERREALAITFPPVGAA